jgi:carboxypeptidase C (cathepsin A)
MLHARHVPPDKPTTLCVISYSPCLAAERYSGYFKLNRTYDAHMFFFYFQARKDPDNAPVVLWHTGGPGCR